MGNHEDSKIAGPPETGSRSHDAADATFQAGPKADQEADRGPHSARVPRAGSQYPDVVQVPCVGCLYVGRRRETHAKNKSGPLPKFQRLWLLALCLWEAVQSAWGCPFGFKLLAVGGCPVVFHIYSNFPCWDYVGIFIQL